MNLEQQATTLLFNQAAMKTVKLLDTCIVVEYADGSEPIYIHSDDTLYEMHLSNFQNLVDQGIKEYETKAAKEADVTIEKE